VQDRRRPRVGANGWPFAMPSVLSGSIIALSRSSQGWLAITRASDSKKRTSYGMVASNTVSAASRQTVAGGLAAAASG
jgi:hypothetical protein